METWLPVVGYEGTYEVSDHGRIRSIGRNEYSRRWDRDRWIAPRVLIPHSNGTTKHQKVWLHKDRSRVRRYIHRLVLEAFVGPCPPDMQTRHLDDDAENNRLENLRWGTQAENIKDRVRNQGPQTHCKRGHSLTPENTYRKKSGSRECRACRRYY